ncbi:MAG: hypothetical protein K2K17_05490, partial [Lachnospiraceae bacterium]|nr:hypothetical protein [Lachnospiraceae bacterium]
GDMIYCVSPHRKFALVIKNIQINGVNTEVVAQKDIDIGIEFDKREGLKIKKSYKFFLISK